MNLKAIDIFLTAVIEKYKEYQKEWLTNHQDIEFEKPEEDLILEFLDNTANAFIMEYTE